MGNLELKEAKRATVYNLKLNGYNTVHYMRMENDFGDYFWYGQTINNSDQWIYVELAEEISVLIENLYQQQFNGE